MVNIKGTTKIIKASDRAELNENKQDEELKKDFQVNDAVDSFVNKEAKGISRVKTILKENTNKLLRATLENKLVLKQKEKTSKSIAKARKLSPAFDKAVKYVDYSINFMMNPQDTKDMSEVVKYTRGPAVFGIWVTVIFFSCFLIWGVFAPLNSAVVADGWLVFESKKRIIQHREGGIIKRLYVKNGDEVDQGELLISLDKTVMQARKDGLQMRLYGYLAENGRLVAERDGLDKIKFDETLLEHVDNKEVAKILQTQEKLFEARRDAFLGKIKVRNERLKQLEARKEASEAQLQAAIQLINITQEQMDSVNKLFEKGNASKNELRRIEQQMTELQAKKAQLVSAIAEANEQMAQENLEIENEKSLLMTDIEKELRQNQDYMIHIAEQFAETEDMYNKLDIVAPISGIVNNLTMSTEGGSLQSGHVVMEIVPTDDKLVIDAKVKMEDIDVVRVGQKVSIRLTPFKSRVVPPLNGRIVNVSADRIMPEYKDDIMHYKTRIEIDKESLQEVSKLKGIELYPGMHAQVMIEVGNRTLLKYLLDPITMSFEKAFIEQ